MTVTISSLAKKAACTLMAGGLAFAFAPTVSASNIQQAFAADDGYTYCYAGLSWAEYWAGEDVYEAGNDASSDKLDSSDQTDCGAYDVVSRATTNHGLHRGSYQCNATIHAKAADGTAKDFAISYWSSDGATFYTTAGEAVSYSRGVCTFEGVAYTLFSYDIYGTKYVPVKVKTSDYDAFKANRAAAGYTVTEDGGYLQGGYSENVLKAYSFTADVDENTHGLKTATKNPDGSFSFSAADESLTGAGIEGQTSLKKVTETTYDAYLSQVQAKAAGTSTDEPSGIYVAVAGSEKGYSTPSIGKDGTASTGSKLSAGSYGEMLRVDLCGDYGDLGAAMQSVTWTYYGNDSTGKSVVRKFGTKFAADNWMHKSMDIQLGLTDSIRCQFPEGYDGNGYWTITVHALGYEDYTTSVFEVTSDDFAQEIPVTSATKAKLQSLVDQAKALKESDYTASSWASLETELDEADELLGDAGTLESEANEQITHVQAAIDALVTAAQLPTAATGLVYNGKAQTGVSGDSKVVITNGTATNAGTYTATVKPADGMTWTDGSADAKTVTYTIAKASQTLSVKTAAKKVKAKKTKKKAQTVNAVTVSGAQGAVGYAKAKGTSAKLKVNAKTGKITVKKGTKKGTYKAKITVKAAGNANYNTASKTVTVKIKVK